MDRESLDSLLYEDESAYLDFKRDQYPFEKASEIEKSELLKDIIGFANGWRRKEAYILIGVEEIQGNKSFVHGVKNHLPDHSLQQFVNNLTNRPIQFGYETCNYDGKQVGIIRINEQERPTYLTKDYGKLRKNQVYVRRGSSTDPNNPATPDEIASMRSAFNPNQEEAELFIEFAEVDSNKSIGTSINLTSELCKMPSAKTIPMLNEPIAQTTLPDGRVIDFPNLNSFDIHDQLNRNYYHELAEYHVIRQASNELKFAITNIGKVPANNVRIEINACTEDNFTIFYPSELPSKPKRRISLIEEKLTHGLGFISNNADVTGCLNISDDGEAIKIEIDFGSLQPGRTIRSDSFYIGIKRENPIKLNGFAYAANLSSPTDFSLEIRPTVNETVFTLDDLRSLDSLLSDG